MRSWTASIGWHPSVKTDLHDQRQTVAAAFGQIPCPSFPVLVIIGLLQYLTDSSTGTRFYAFLASYTLFSLINVSMGMPEPFDLPDDLARTLADAPPAGQAKPAVDLDMISFQVIIAPGSPITTAITSLVGKGHFYSPSFSVSVQPLGMVTGHIFAVCFTIQPDPGTVRIGQQRKIDMPYYHNSCQTCGNAM